MLRPLARLALVPWLAAGCFHDSQPPLTGGPTTDPTDAATATDATSSSSSSSTSSTSTDADPSTGDPPATSTTAPVGSTGDCPLGQDAVFYADLDGDGWGAGEPKPFPCEAPPGTVDKPGDCNDNAIGVNPGADELCNGLDDDCDTLLDEYSTKNTFCKNCVLGTHDGASYWACQDPQDQDGARSLCQQLGPGVQLAVADDQSEHDFLHALALSSFPNEPDAIHFYLGLTRRMDLWDDCSVSPNPVAWLTPAGTPAPYLKWTPGEPNNQNCSNICMTEELSDPACKRENCVEMANLADGSYNDVFCGIVHSGYFCESAP